jgi:hypothetical protein
MMIRSKRGCAFRIRENVRSGTSQCLPNAPTPEALQPLLSKKMPAIQDAQLFAFFDVLEHIEDNSKFLEK